jgi:hypothetical protein
MAPDLDMSLLYRMLRELGRLRAEPSPISTLSFEGLIEKTAIWRSTTSGIDT